MVSGQCRFCHEWFYDTTTCPRCLSRHLKAVKEGKSLFGIAVIDMSHSEYAEFGLIAEQLENNEISETKAKDLTNQHIAAIKRRISKKLENEKRHREADEKYQMQQKRLFDICSNKN